MKMKSILPDLVFIIVITAIFVILSETGNLNFLIKYPVITFLVIYFIGRFAGYFSHRKRGD